MTAEQFCYWLQGRAELQPDKIPTAAEWKMIREHLQTVFVKITPSLGIPGVIVKDGPDHQIRPQTSIPQWWPWQTTTGVPSTTCGIPIATC